MLITITIAIIIALILGKIKFKEIKGYVNKLRGKGAEGTARDSGRDTFAGRKEGNEEGREEGLAEGRATAILENARKMKELGIDAETIMQVTGLDRTAVGNL